MNATVEDAVQWGSLESLEPVSGPSPFELELEPLAVDGRRPWPLGIPAGREVLEVLADRDRIARGLKAAHLEVLRLLPPQLLDSVEACLAGTDDPLAFATIDAWRAMMAAAGSSDALGVDQPALRLLIDQAAAAREKVQALGYFSLDGGVGAAPFLHALGEAIELLVSRARFVARPRVPRSRTSTTANLKVLEATSRALKAATAVVMLGAAIFHSSGAIEERRARGEWVVVGDVDRGRAFLAPGSEASEAALRSKLEQLATVGIAATKTASGEWVLHRSTAGAQ